jgi:hypothetical protein
VTKERWLAARKADLLPIPYFHVVFTLPHDLNALAQGNPRVMYTLLFRAAADTLLTVGRDLRHLGGTIGLTAILHTWGQNLSQHLHLHCLVTGGALARDRTRWITGRSSFLFPVRALSTVFRAKYLAGLQALLRFIAQAEFRYGVRSIAHLIDSIPHKKNAKELRLSDLKLPLTSPKALKESSLAYHLLHEEQAHGVVSLWKGYSASKASVPLYSETLEFFHSRGVPDEVLTSFILSRLPGELSRER